MTFTGRAVSSRRRERRSSGRRLVTAGGSGSISVPPTATSTSWPADCETRDERSADFGRQLTLVFRARVAGDGSTPPAPRTKPSAADPRQTPTGDRGRPARRDPGAAGGGRAPSARAPYAS